MKPHRVGIVVQTAMLCCLASCVAWQRIDHMTLSEVKDSLRRAKTLRIGLLRDWGSIEIIVEDGPSPVAILLPLPSTPNDQPPPAQSVLFLRRKALETTGWDKDAGGVPMARLGDELLSALQRCQVNGNWSIVPVLPEILRGRSVWVPRDVADGSTRWRIDPRIFDDQ